MGRSLVLCLLLVVGAAEGFPRSRAVLHEFRREHPCPSTGAARGACPGFEIDHVQPLCAGGLDDVSNLQWLSLEAHRLKTKRDVAACRGRAVGSRVSPGRGPGRYRTS